MRTRRAPDKAVADILAHRDDPGEWGEESVTVEVKPSRMELVSFRLASDELDELQKAAAAAGESISNYVRTAVAMRLGRSGGESSFEVMSGYDVQVIFRGTWLTPRTTWGGALRWQAAPLEAVD